MTSAKVLNNNEISKEDLQLLKIEKVKTAKKCCVEGCCNIGRWNPKLKDFYLRKNMCYKHYARAKKYGDVNFVKTVFGENRGDNELYGTYRHLKKRCYSEKNPSYKDYGGRGITMSDEWLNSFQSFCSDMGNKPSPQHSIDRRNNDLGYSKENCYWATKHQQNANKRNNNEVVGVYKVGENTWVASLKIEKKYVLRESFHTKDDAISARKNAELEYNIVYNK